MRLSQQALAELERRLAACVPSSAELRLWQLPRWVTWPSTEGLGRNGSCISGSSRLVKEVRKFRPLVSVLLIAKGRSLLLTSGGVQQQLLVAVVKQRPVDWTTTFPWLPFCYGLLLCCSIGYGWLFQAKQ